MELQANEIGRFSRQPHEFAGGKGYACQTGAHSAEVGAE